MNEATRSGKSTIRLLGISAERPTNGLYLYLLHIYVCIYIYIYIYIYTHVFLKKLIVSELVRKFLEVYRTHSVMTVFTQTRCLSLSWPRSIRSTSQPISLTLILIPSSRRGLGLQSCLLPLGFPTKLLCTVCIWINVTKCGSFSRLKHSATQIPVADFIVIILVDAELRDVVMWVLESDLASISFAFLSLDKTRNSTRPCLLGLRPCVYAEAVQVVRP
jgi:hypothetical protein